MGYEVFLVWIVLTQEQYELAIFDCCPVCSRHLSLWRRVRRMVCLEDV